MKWEKENVAEINRLTGANLDAQKMFMMFGTQDIIGAMKELQKAFSNPRAIAAIRRYPGFFKDIAGSLNLSVADLKQLDRVIRDFEKSSGRRIFDEILAGGARASNRQTGSIKEENWADLMVLDEDSFDLAFVEEDKIIDKFVFVSGTKLVTDVWSAGRHVVKEGKHINRDQIIKHYNKTISNLGDRI